MQTIIGIANLKEQYMLAKLKAGDMRGMTHSSRFKLAEKFSIPAMQVAFNTVAPKEGKIEVETSIYVDDQSAGYAYNWETLIEGVKDETGVIELQFVKVKWNKYGTDADRSNIGESFIYKNNEKKKQNTGTISI